MAHIKTMTQEYRKETIALQLRRADMDEVVACTGNPPHVVLAESIDSSVRSWVMIHKGNVEGVFGIAENLGWGVPWMLATDGIKYFSRQFLRESKKVVAEWISEYPRLYNHVDSRHIDAIWWLRWLGFRIHTNEPITLHDPSVSFYPFTMHRSIENV